jgi:hypothetical protein
MSGVDSEGEAHLNGFTIFWFDLLYTKQLNSA